MNLSVCRYWLLLLLCCCHFERHIRSKWFSRLTVLFWLVNVSVCVRECISSLARSFVRSFDFLLCHQHSPMNGRFRCLFHSGFALLIFSIAFWLSHSFCLSHTVPYVCVLVCISSLKMPNSCNCAQHNRND